MVGITLGDGALYAELLNGEGEFVWDAGESALGYREAPRQVAYSPAVGFPYAISGGSEDDMVTMDGDPIPISRLAEAYPRERAKAEEKWRNFATWLKKHRGVDLPDPEIMLACIEVA